MYGSRLLARSLNQSSPLLRQLLSQKPLARTRELPLEVTARLLATKDVKKIKEVKDSGPTVIGPGGNVLVPPVTLKIIPFRMPPDLPYDDRNEMRGRVLSPHLTIYKIQLTSLLSICLRISGFVLAVFVWALGISGLCMQGDMDGFVKKAEDCDCPALLTASKVMVVAPFAYHTVAGTRHLIWYLNKFTTIPEIYATGYVAVVLATALAAGLLIMDVGEKAKEVVDLSKQPKGKKPPPPPKKEEKKPPPKKEEKKDPKGKADPKAKA